MGQAVTCDSCGNNVDVHGRSQVVISTKGYAGNVVDLCEECTKDIVSLRVIKKAVRNVRKERRDQIVANGGIPGPELFDPEEDEDGNPIPIPDTVPEVDAEPTEAVAT